MTTSGFQQRILYVVVVLLVIAFHQVKAGDVVESSTGWTFPDTYDNCAHTIGGHIDKALWTYALVLTYKCEHETIVLIKVYTTWITNFVYGEATAGLIATKDEHNNYIISQDQQNTIRPLLTSVTDTL